jgi:hypothetical protein
VTGTAPLTFQALQEPCQSCFSPVKQQRSRIPGAILAKDWQKPPIIDVDCAPRAPHRFADGTDVELAAAAD